MATDHLSLFCCHFFSLAKQVIENQQQKFSRETNTQLSLASPFSFYRFEIGALLNLENEPRFSNILRVCHPRIRFVRVVPRIRGALIRNPAVLLVIKCGRAHGITYRPLILAARLLELLEMFLDFNIDVNVFRVAKRFMFSN